jgi:hypothetical protein
MEIRKPRMMGSSGATEQDLSAYLHRTEQKTLAAWFFWKITLSPCTAKKRRVSDRLF